MTRNGPSPPVWIITAGTHVFLKRIQDANGDTLEDARQLVLAGLGGISIGLQIAMLINRLSRKALTARLRRG